MPAVLFPRFSHPAVLKKFLALLAVLSLIAVPGRTQPVPDWAMWHKSNALFPLLVAVQLVAANPVSAPPPVNPSPPVRAPKPPATAIARSGVNPEIGGWKPMPMDVRREVDAFFMNLELAINYNRLDLVMALYTPDAVEEKADGGRLVFAGIRQSRQEEMDKMAKAGRKPATIQRNHLLYKPGTAAAEFKVIYPVRIVGSVSGMPPSIDSIVYTFRRNTIGLRLSSTVVRAIEAKSLSDPAPSQGASVDGPPPTQIRLTNGAILRQIKVLHWEPDSVLIQYVGGTVPIRLINIHPDDRAYFTANMDRALQAQKEEALNSARANAMRSQIDEQLTQNQAAITAEQQEVQETRESQIEEATANRRLMLGMTMDQVRRSWGTPSQVDQVETQIGHAVLWTYGGRGIDEHGLVYDAGIAFMDEKVRVLVNVMPKDKQ